jgi:hypothetical protein
MKKRIKMLEYTDLDDLGVAHDIIRQRKIDVALQLGKHSTDEALTFYCANRRAGCGSWAGVPRRRTTSRNITAATFSATATRPPATGWTSSSNRAFEVLGDGRRGLDDPGVPATIARRMI